MTKKILFSLFAFTLLLAVACRKDSIITETTMEPTPPVITVETSVIGLVTDLDGNALEGAHLTLGNSQTTSDENGYFKLSGLTDSDNAIVKVEMNGYFDAWHAFQPFEEDIAQTTVRLTPRSNPLNINADNGGEIQFENAKVSFAAGSFVDESGNAYSGNVSVFTAYLDPTDPELHTFMPGNLTAFDANNRLQLLETFGMINVELEGDAGQKLQINHPAKIEMAIPSTILNRAPATIPLWYFDTEKARWVEEGSATLQNGNYVGTVTHFTFWNCDVPNDFIQLDGQAYFGELSAALLVCVTNQENGEKRCTQTSANNGYFSGAVPPNTTFLLEIFSTCGDLVYSTNIGPFTDDATVGPFLINPTQTTWAYVHGNVIDCDGNAVTDGYVYAKLPNNPSEIFQLNPDGSFAKYINTCNATEITLKAYDIANYKFGDPTVFALTFNTDVGELEACVNDIVDGVTIQYGGNTLVMLGATITDVPSGGQNSVYQFTVTDDQGNGNKVIYVITILDWTGQPNSTFSVATQSTVFGSPTNILNSIGNENIVLQEFGTMPGEFIRFDITDVNVDIGGVNYPNSSIEIVGLIE
ncbi:MAG: carboxypeptidase-like regulatory domain-containing protein [Saprospiraceae bacterium]